MTGPRTGPGQAAAPGQDAAPGQGAAAGWAGGESWSRAGWQAHLPDAGDIPGYVEKLSSHTIPALIAAATERSPGEVAVTFDGEPVTYAALDAGTAAVATWLAGRIGPGDRVLLAAGSGAAFLRCYLGTLRAGAVAVLANPGYTAAELAHLVTDSGARIAFADPGPARLLTALPQPPLVVSTHSLPAGGPAAGDRAARAHPSGIAVLAYTSGTTGRPKGVPLTHRQLLASIRPAMAAWRWTAGDVLVHALPLFHQHGLGGLQASLIAGGRAHIQSRFDPSRLLAAVRSTRASVLLAVPAMYQRLLQVPGQPPLASLRLAVCGSAPLSPGLAARLPELLGRLPLVRYGTTETGLNVSHTLNGVRPGSVGVPLPGVLARVWAEGRDAPPGTDGDIQLRGPSVFGGYWGEAGEAATASAFTADGWFTSGDIGRADPATGQLEIRGRIKEMIISGGLNVYPREVEMVLEGHPSVAEAAVAGLPHERWGEQVTAWVVLRSGHRFDEQQLIAHARTALAAYKCPKQVFNIAALPRNASGKLLRGQLAPAPGGGGAGRRASRP